MLLLLWAFLPLLSCQPWVEPGASAGPYPARPTMVPPAPGQVYATPQVPVTPSRPSVRVREPGAVGGEKKWLAGAVTFRGLTEGQLAALRVIPEGSTEIFQPRNGRYTQVDGFWWRGDPVNWYKIPDHAEAWVVGPQGVAPSQHEGVDQRQGFAVYRKALPGLGAASALRGGVSEAGFYPRRGRTMIGVAYPF
ncbi:MAG: hypothetical protein ACQKBY_00060 [Verrucomicrobiales bacterium]